MGDLISMDLIERQAVIDALESKTYRHTYLDQIVGIIEDLPSAQPEIIRCKDCEHWDKTWTNDWTKDYHYCPMVDGVRKVDFYCADAERRTDG